METPGDEVWGRAKVTARVSIFCLLRRHLIERQNNWVKGAETDLSVTVFRRGHGRLDVLLEKKLTFTKALRFSSPFAGRLRDRVIYKMF